jgi:hypothetical protein
MGWCHGGLDGGFLSISPFASTMTCAAWRTGEQARVRVTPRSESGFSLGMQPPAAFACPRSCIGPLARKRGRTSFSCQSLSTLHDWCTGGARIWSVVRPAVPGSFGRLAPANNDSGRMVTVGLAGGAGSQLVPHDAHARLRLYVQKCMPATGRCASVSRACGGMVGPVGVSWHTPSGNEVLTWLLW